MTRRAVNSHTSIFDGPLYLFANDKLRLSHIKLAGFKSFVDPTEIPLPGDLVGVVGPNGCGKSNIIDAVRWVLGESKASALRGESMQDVIFNGSANRKQVGRASVELTFDNSLGKAAGQWSSYGEICIKRVLRRDGESTYHINNIHVRRRDIADIFLGTGLGGRGYAIIEQGMISRIIEAKPDELKVFLEEAAGISRYRERRRETESRLADTRENLLRVNDICQELEKQLARLERQASVVRQFQEMQARLQTTQILLWHARRREAALQRTLAEKELQTLQTALDEENAELRHAEKQLEEKRARHYETGDRLHEAQGALYAVNAEVAQAEQEIRHMRDNHQRMAQQIATAKSQLEHNIRQAEAASDNLVQWRMKHEHACAAYEASKEKAATENGSLPAVEAAFRSCRQTLTETQHELLLITQAGRLEESHRDHAEKNICQLESRHSRLQAEQDGLPHPGAEELADLGRRSDAISDELKRKQESLAQTEGSLFDAEEAKRELERKVQLEEQRIIQAEARLHALQRLQNRLEGSEGLNIWLAHHQLATLPRLWQGIQIEKGWDDALEAILRERLNGIQLGELATTQEWAENTPPGKCTLFEPAGAAVENLDKMSAATDDMRAEGLIPFQTYVRCDIPGIRCVLDDWLNGIFAVNDLSSGLLQRQSLGTGEMLITREGHIITRHSLTYYAPDSQLHGVLARQREIAQIESEVSALKENLLIERSMLDAAEDACCELGTVVSGLRDDDSELRQQHHDVQMQALKLSQLVERVDQRRRQIDDELAEIAQQVEAEALRKQESLVKLVEYQDQTATLQERVEKEKRESEAAEQALDTQRRLAQDASSRMQEAAYHEKTCAGKIMETESSIRAIDANVVDLQAQLRKMELQQGQFDETNLKNVLHDRLTLRGQREQKLAMLRTLLEEAATELREVEKERMTCEQKLHPLREAINQARLKEQEARITENQFAELLKGSGLTLEGEGGREEVLDQTLEKTPPSRLQADIDRLNREIAGLGAVNLGALDELQSCQERKTYLDSQALDLEEASETLKNAIRRIDRETRERLTETVEKVNGYLEEMFPVMFGGGQARLILKGEEILDAGIQIFAQPPGKKNSSIHLLSGGEKALTALAFVFSLFQLNPAPFCLLDEVDAPLDDSNTERFCNLVRKMSRQTQFVFISHNKITMELAQQLIGITMQERGVSRVVAVEIEEALRLNDAAMAT